MQHRLRAAVAHVVTGRVLRYNEAARAGRNQLIAMDLAWVPLISSGAVSAVLCCALELTGNRPAGSLLGAALTPTGQPRRSMGVGDRDRPEIPMERKLRTLLRTPAADRPRRGPSTPDGVPMTARSVHEALAARGRPTAEVFR